VTALINELAAQPDQREVLLVLDDYHLIEAQPVHASLGFLVEHRPRGLCLVLASRADPALRLARVRARGQLLELRAAQLRFTSQEAGDLLREVVGSARPDAAVAALTARTEGWAAGLRLAGLSLRGQPDVSALAASFSGSHRYVLDFLSEEVLERQPDPVREFLLATSVLERLSGALCDAVTGRSDGLLVRSEGATLQRWLEALPAELVGARPRLCLTQARLAILGRRLEGHRELEVLRLLASGKPNQQIAEELVVALNTVKKHVGHILSKLGAANCTEATARARELGLLR
jgi:ATP/maltotriose-dependent transcriptional regulator MalT